ncbi:MAG: sodium-translocating pyrophosphatase [Phycisphaeraceae bacterium]|nr:sodium-translocating pyrophosphatase [Phycisphaeraceae bacterium]MCW5753167.1 sodium-translocating pyrophosphatase [Phycisphaeraceae bacterium]
MPMSSLLPAAVADFPLVYWLAPIGAIAALVMAKAFTGSVLKRGEGDEEQIRIAAAVRDGAMAYLKRQYRIVTIVFVVLVALLGMMAALRLQPALTMLGVPIAGLLSGLCGWFGMRMATSASNRTAAAAKNSLNEGLQVAFRAGAVMGLNVVGFALLDVSVWFLILNGFGEQIGLTGDIRETTTVALSFAMGASAQALFARVGGGIYTKAADVGADLVGKVEAGIPEDDARNPATIADNVGDNVGDVAGMGADLYESYYGSVLSTAALGAAAAFTIPTLTNPGEFAMRLAAAPLALAGFGILASIFGIFMVRTKENAGFSQLLQALNKGIHIAAALIIFAAFAIPYLLFGSGEGAAQAQAAGLAWYGVGGSIIAGLVAGLVIAKATEYYTSYEYRPTKSIAEQALTGPATVIISGIAIGMKSTWASLLTIVVAVIAAFTFSGGGESFLLGLYGVAIAAVGMLATLGITLATDAYGPIADNAGGNAEMSSQPPIVRQRTDMLDSLGNTTAAIGKGFAIGSAALTALALFAAYVQVVQTQLFRQSETYVATANYERPEGDAPYAVYEGHGKFAIVQPRAGGTKPYVDGAMLNDHLQVAGTHFWEAIKPGMTFSVTPLKRQGVAGAATIETARRFELSGTIQHGTGASAHADPVSLTVVGTRNGVLADVIDYYDVSLTNPRVLGGIFMGTLLTFLFCSMTMQAVGRAAYSMMNECRRQFGKMREAFRSQGMSEQDISDPEKWPKRVEHQGVQYPDYATCVSISTAGAQREMVVPSILAITVPLLVGLVLSVPGVMGMLAGGLASGFAVAIYMANAGGAWDNAKKYIESKGRITAKMLVDNTDNARERVPAAILDQLMAKAKEYVDTGHGDRYVYGKGSDDHKATVVGDTVGDPFKDTSGPSLNILIKLISIVSVVFAGLIVKFGPIVGEMIGLH